MIRSIAIAAMAASISFVPGSGSAQAVFADHAPLQMAQGGGHGAGGHGAGGHGAAGHAAAGHVAGEVTRINRDTNKVTIRHGPIPNLDMPGMTMVFALKDPKMIDRLKVGSKIEFAADKIDGTYTVTSIESVR